MLQLLELHMRTRSLRTRSLRTQSLQRAAVARGLLSKSCSPSRPGMQVQLLQVHDSTPGHTQTMLESFVAVHCGYNRAKKVFKVERSICKSRADGMNLMQDGDGWEWRTEILSVIKPLVAGRAGENQDGVKEAFQLCHERGVRRWRLACLSCWHRFGLL